MAVQVKVRHDRQIICPLRFTRAVTGAPVIDAPDVDDRGFAMGTRPGTWGSSPTRGAMVGVTEGDTVRIKVLREDMDATAPLFATSTDVACVEVVAPAGGGPIPADGIFQIRGVKDFANRAVAVEVRLGSTTGPVLGALEPHIFQLRRFAIFAHFVTIRAVTTARTVASVTASMPTINAIFRPLGIEFTFDPANSQTENVINRNNGTPFAVPGQMTTAMDPSIPGHTDTPADWREFSTLINTRPVTASSRRINVYFVQAANEVNGLTFANDVRRPNGYGIVIADAATDTTIAHELCHYLDNDHAEEAIAPGATRADMWVLRRLMLGPQPAATGIPHRDDTGYGNLIEGGLVTVKDLPTATVDQTDNETARSRRRSLNPF